MFQFLTHVELSRSTTAILEMPQYVAYQKNIDRDLRENEESGTLAHAPRTVRLATALMVSNHCQEWLTIFCRNAQNV